MIGNSCERVDLRGCVAGAHEGLLKVGRSVCGSHRSTTASVLPQRLAVSPAVTHRTRLALGPATLVAALGMGPALVTVQAVDSRNNSRATTEDRGPTMWAAIFALPEIGASPRRLLDQLNANHRRGRTTTA